MAVPKINGDAYISNTSDNSYMPNGKLLNHVGACAVTYNGDFRIEYGSSWSHYILPFNFQIYNSNPQLFQVYDNGIKILKNGYYIISGVVNVDFPENTTGGFVLLGNTSSNEMRTSDVRSSGMTSCFSSPMLIYLTAGQIIHAGFRHQSGGTSFLSRGLRSQLLVQAV